ncbi:MAG: aspartate-semialdehyde dehydrogenase [Rickettsiales bacterium]|nr:aspartate-semialdehyde dehydrogenase [Rickettsiales bacterium]OUV80859.1 MAG: aspartate-semialdehyde dehydrogenase [Rickettsiales bacterium TMED131]
MGYRVAIVGATGAVGHKLLSTIIERKFPAEQIHLLASKKSEGKKINFNNQDFIVKDLEKFDFSNTDIAFFSAGASISSQYAIKAEKNNCYVIDNTSFFRMNEDIPLIIPEVNEDKLQNITRKIIANPNCSTIQMLVALYPINKVNKIKRIIVSTYQSVSGAGQKAINELSEQSKSLLNNQKAIINNFPKRIAFNVIPQIDVFTDNNFTKEEMKMVNESKKILDKDIEVNATCVRVPSYTGHAESVYIELEKNIEISLLEEALNNAKGVVYSNDHYHTPIDSAEKDYVYVSRLRKDLEKDNVFNLWVVSDNLLKGAALNSVQIAESLIQKNMVTSYE